MHLGFKAEEGENSVGVKENKEEQGTNFQGPHKGCCLSMFVHQTWGILCQGYGNVLVGDFTTNLGMP